MEFLVTKTGELLLVRLFHCGRGLYVQHIKSGNIERLGDTVTGTPTELERLLKSNLHEWGYRFIGRVSAEKDNHDE